MRPTPLLFLLVVALAGCAAPETALSGQARDQDTGEPVPGARVVATSGAREAHGQTGEDGRYRIVLPAGEWRITVTAPGYEAEESTLSIRENAEVIQDFSLVRSGNA